MLKDAMEQPSASHSDVLLFCHTSVVSLECRCHEHPGQKHAWSSRINSWPPKISQTITWNTEYTEWHHIQSRCTWRTTLWGDESWIILAQCLTDCLYVIASLHATYNVRLGSGDLHERSWRELNDTKWPGRLRPRWVRLGQAVRRTSWLVIRIRMLFPTRVWNQLT